MNMTARSRTSRPLVSARGSRGSTAARSGDRLDDPHDEAHLAAFEEYARVSLGQLEVYRSNPMPHLSGLDLSCYDRDYAPPQQRDSARRAHLAQWPQAVDAAIAALDRLSAPVAQALAGAVRGLAADIPADAHDDVQDAALAAHARLVGTCRRRPTGRLPRRRLGAGRSRR